MPLIKEKYNKEVIPAMREKFKYSNDLSVPKVLKITLNSGTGAALQDSKMLDVVANTLTRITGQKPVMTKAGKSIAAFKIREGMTVGVSVTLRGKRMFDFLDKLVNVSLPRVRDFQGISSSSLDDQGNLTIGFKEHIMFPEIGSDEIEKIHGLEVTVSTSANSKEEGLALLTMLGFPFKKS